MRKLFSVKFSEHLSAEYRRTLASNLDAMGLLILDDPNSDVRLVVFREAKIAYTRSSLANWERLGWLKWSEEVFRE